MAIVAMLLIPLWLVSNHYAYRGGFVREVRLCFLTGALAGTAAVFMIPILIRGDWVQRILALVLLLLPLLALISVLLKALELSS